MAKENLDLLSDKKTFLDTLNRAVEDFSQNKLVDKIQSKEITVKDYHSLLLMVFHQTYVGPSTFALASAYCTPAQETMRAYLIGHAEEEKDHWKWVLGDLKSTGYTGPDPRSMFPPEPCRSYIAFNYYAAQMCPPARLAIAAFLESLGAKFGKRYASATSSALKLTPQQMVFFFGHGDTDVGHTKEIFDLFETLQLSASDWGWMGHAVSVASKLYKRMFDESVG